MKKMYVVMLSMIGILSLTACSKADDVALVSECGCRNCKCCTCEKYNEEEEALVAVEKAEDVFIQESETATEGETVEVSQTENATVPGTLPEGETVIETEPESQQVVEKTVAELTDGEKAARKQNQANYAAAREQIYNMANSIEKTQRINEMDKQILANNSYDFSSKKVQFYGDSITEAICGNVDESGRFISYVNYADDYLKFGTCMNHGKAGRMFSDYGGTELSFSHSIGDTFNNSADISVIFLGVNDYLTGKEGKRYGDINQKESSAGYVGAVRNSMKQLKANYPNQDIFFVMMYDISKTVNSTYTDVAGSVSFAEYIEVLRTLVKENGYHLIELYDTGFMDCNDTATSGTYTADGLHPNDAGNRILGEHIAAELSLYYSQKQ